LSEAEQILAMLKSEELQGLLKRAGSGPTEASLDGREASEVRSQDGLNKEWVKVSQEFASLDGVRASERTAVQAARYQQLLALRTESRAQLTRWLNDLQVSLSADTGSAQAQRDQIAQLGRVMQGVVSSTPGAAVGLQFVLTDNRLSILFHTKAGSAAKQVLVKASEIRKQVARLRAVLDDPSKDPLAASQALYNTLIGPVSAELSEAAPKTLILNLSDVLRYVPFSALHDGKQYLAERMAIAMYTSAGGSSIRAQPGAGWRIAGLGLTEAKAGFAALPSVRDELEGIVKSDANARGVLPGSLAIDSKFNEESIRDAMRDAVSVLHLATHFHFQPGNEHGS
jgi:CHAT domain-containing protein